VYWIDLAQDRDKWKALLNAVTNIKVPYYAGKFLSSCTADGLLSSTPHLSCMINKGEKVGVVIWREQSFGQHMRVSPV
jgi:hypothetical protein